MSTAVLHEHDANQGAQSQGEFLGMTGNSGWYLLGSAGSTVMMVIVLWGVLGVPLLLCLLVGVVLCLLSVVYVFTLKNNRPAHYDTDFFEAALIEAGLMELAFGPRARRLPNPFHADAPEDEASPSRPAPARPQERQRSSSSDARRAGPSGGSVPAPWAAAEAVPEPKRVAPRPADDAEPTVPLRTYEKLQGELELTRDELAEALVEREGV